MGDTAEGSAATASTAAETEREADERVDRLLDGGMRAHRRTLLGVLEFCQDRRSTDEVEAKVAELDAEEASVFDAPSYCRQLEEAGALERVQPESAEADGNPGEQDGPTQADSGEQGASDTDAPAQDDPAPGDDPGASAGAADPAPTANPTQDAQLLWQTTVAGLRALRRHDPCDAVAQLVASQPAYEDIYLRLLCLCDADGGSTAQEMGRTVDDDPALQQPRLYAQHFFNQLARCGAIAWSDHAWHTTERGRAYLKTL